MNWKIISALLVVCLGLGIYVYLETNADSSDPVRKTEIERIISFEPEQVERLKISFLDSIYQVRRRGKEWVMEQPFAGTLADSAMVNHLLGTLVKVPVIHSLPVDSVNLAQLYLDDPAVLFTLYFAGGDSSSVGFGVLNPTTDNIYARRDHQDRVLMTGKEIGPMLYVGSMLMRSKQLVSISPYRVKQIRLTARQGWESVLERDPATGEWSVRGAKISPRADKRLILDLMSTLYGAQVREFLEADAVNDARSGLNRPVRRLVVLGDQGDSVTVSIGRARRGSEYLLCARSSIYPENLLLVDSSLVGMLDVLRPERITDLRVNHIDRSGLDRVELVYSRETIVLEADNDTLWRLVQPKVSPCKLWQVERLLTHVDTMQALRILRPGRGRGFDRPQFEMTASRGADKVIRLLVGDYKGGDSLYLRNELSGMDYLVHSKEMEKLSYTFEDFADVPIKQTVE